MATVYIAMQHFKRPAESIIPCFEFNSPKIMFSVEAFKYKCRNIFLHQVWLESLKKKKARKCGPEDWFGSQRDLGGLGLGEWCELCALAHSQ